MNILWLINIPLPEASLLMNEQPLPYGGWIVNASDELSKKEDLNLSISFPHSRVSGYKKLKGKSITYYPFKSVKDNDRKSIDNNCIVLEILNEVKPELVHIYGTELAHTLSMVNACNKLNIKIIISIQGLVSYCEKHMLANLPFYVVYGVTLRNILRKDSVIGLKHSFINRGKNEIESIRKVKHIIGRTFWDKACITQINPDAKYHFCNETLRSSFYEKKWDINKCEKFSIFVSQGQYPIKGLHYILEAMPTIIRKFPTAKLYISGKDITKTNTIKDKLLLTYYGKYIKRMIRKHNLESNVRFVGLLNENEICERYLKSHVFVCPSSIENSPNSLGEAMLLGVPCVASNVGGVSDLLLHKEEGFLYQADASYMLAYYICQIFERMDLALKFSFNARQHALKLHDVEENTKRLLEIYEEMHFSR